MEEEGTPGNNPGNLWQLGQEEVLDSEKNRQEGIQSLKPTPARQARPVFLLYSELKPRFQNLLSAPPSLKDRICVHVYTISPACDHRGGQLTTDRHRVKQ